MAPSAVRLVCRTTVGHPLKKTPNQEAPKRANILQNEQDIYDINAQVANKRDITLFSFENWQPTNGVSASSRLEDIGNPFRATSHKHRKIFRRDGSICEPSTPLSISTEQRNIFEGFNSTPGFNHFSIKSCMGFSVLGWPPLCVFLSPAGAANPEIDQSERRSLA